MKNKERNYVERSGVGQGRERSSTSFVIFQSVQINFITH